MKKTIFVIFLIVEVLLIISLCISSAYRKSEACGAVIVIPADLQLTTDYEIKFSKNGTTLMIPQNTKIIPRHINNSYVYFDYDSQEMIKVSWNDIKEQDALLGLRSAAENRKKEDQRHFMILGVVTSVVASTLWICFALFIMSLVEKKQTIMLLWIVHLIVLVSLVILHMICNIYMVH